MSSIANKQHVHLVPQSFFFFLVRDKESVVDLMGKVSRRSILGLFSSPLFLLGRGGAAQKCPNCRDFYGV